MENETLPRINFYGHEWGVLQDWLQKELLDCYKHLARTDISEAEGHQIRGRIAFITKMLELPGLYAAFNGPQ